MAATAAPTRIFVEGFLIGQSQWSVSLEVLGSRAERGVLAGFGTEVRSTPAWADYEAPGGAEVAAIRNDTLHEALFMDAPLGFAVHKEGGNQNLTLEMSALVCRLLVALIGGHDAAYVRSPVNTRAIHGLDLSASKEGNFR